MEIELAGATDLTAHKDWHRDAQLGTVNGFLFPQVTTAHVLDMSRAGDVALAERMTDGRLVEVATFGDVLDRSRSRHRWEAHP